MPRCTVIAALTGWMLLALAAVITIGARSAVIAALTRRTVTARRTVLTGGALGTLTAF